jgi:AbrB family looped-hinge helix DNA binding protein
MQATTTRLSSKGQIVIPAWVRRALNFQPGDELTVEIGPTGDRTIVLRGHTTDEVERTLTRGYQWLEASGADPVGAFHEARRRARAHERRRRRR